MTQTDMTPLQRLAKVLQLGTPSNYRNHTYINGESLYFPTGRVYGGQVIAQSLMAASRTVAPSRLPNSIHGYFISAGDIRQDLLFDVENLRDGRSFLRPSRECHAGAGLDFDGNRQLPGT